MESYEELPTAWLDPVHGPETIIYNTSVHKIPEKGQPPRVFQALFYLLIAI